MVVWFVGGQGPHQAPDLALPNVKDAAVHHPVQKAPQALTLHDQGQGLAQDQGRDQGQVEEADHDPLGVQSPSRVPGLSPAPGHQKGDRGKGLACGGALFSTFGLALHLLKQNQDVTLAITSQLHLYSRTYISDPLKQFLTYLAYLTCISENSLNKL